MLSQATNGEPTNDTSPPKQSANVGAADNTILDEITVTATRRPTREGDTTAVTYVVDKTDIKATGAVTVTDALVLLPGLQFAPALGGVRNFGNNYLRGFNDQRFFVLRDGVLVNRPDNNSSDISRFSVADVERVEVFSGGSVLRYGAGAVGGVINIITETPKGQPKLTLGYEAGSYGFSRYLAKYGGGDDTFSYNLGYYGIVAFNDYPFTFTLPNQAQFYGSTDVTPAGVPLFGLLKPEVGPPVLVSGRADQSYAASDTYSAKLSFKPDPYNSLVLKLNQQNSKNAFVSPGSNIYPYGVCRGGQPGSRLLPVDLNGNELPCDTQRYLPNTATTAFISSRFAYNASADGRILFPTGQSYPAAEAATASVAFNEQSTQSETQATLYWNHEPSPGLSLKSYVNYFKFTQPVYQPPYFINTNVLAPFVGLTPVGQAALLPVVAPIPFGEGSRVEAQSVLDARLSPGQVLSFGVNFQEDRSLTRFDNSGFSDRSLSRTAFFVIDDINFGPELQANVGLRHTISNQAGSYLVPAAGLRYSPDKTVSLRANWSQVVNLPPIDELYTFASGAPFASNPNLKPETGVTYDVGLDITPAPNLGLRLTYFNTYIDNYRVAVAEPNSDPFSAFPLIFRSQNVGSRYASGLEVELNYRFTEHWRFRGAWTNTDSRPYGVIVDQNSSLYPFYFGYQDPGIPFNSVSATLAYENEGFLVSLLGRYDGGKRRGFAGGSIPQGGEQFLSAWATMDLYFEVPLTPFFKVTGAVQNLTDTQYEYLSGVPAPGTTFRLGGRLEFGL
ncbi:MAG: TonB-dependent receptor [Gemmatimonadaceae bacterium]|nr:TonB-dependent receptor [Gloeobacterales cyanobacterium ES-bin-141]